MVRLRSDRHCSPSLHVSRKTTWQNVYNTFLSPCATPFCSPSSCSWSLVTRADQLKIKSASLTSTDLNVTRADQFEGFSFKLTACWEDVKLLPACLDSLSHIHTHMYTHSHSHSHSTLPHIAYSSLYSFLPSLQHSLSLSLFSTGAAISLIRTKPLAVW